MSFETVPEKQQLLPFSAGKARDSLSSSKVKLSALLSCFTATAGNAGALRVLAAFGVSAAWMFVSSLLILVNKHILKDLKFG